MSQPNILVVMVDQLAGTLFPDGPAGWLHAPNLKALAASDNDIPFYVALPSTTIDWQTRDGIAEIPIEERGADEVTLSYGRHGEQRIAVRTVAEGSPVGNPAFDVTPARLVTGLITERGVCAASEEGLTGLFPEEAAS